MSSGTSHRHRPRWKCQMEPGVWGWHVDSLEQLITYRRPVGGVLRNQTDPLSCTHVPPTNMENAGSLTYNPSTSLWFWEQSRHPSWSEVMGRDFEPHPPRVLFHLQLLRGPDSVPLPSNTTIPQGQRDMFTQNTAACCFKQLQRAQFYRLNGMNFSELTSSCYMSFSS